MPHYSIQDLSLIHIYEQIRVDRQNSDDQKEKIELLIELESSRSFASTHATVEKMRSVDTWTQEEREAILSLIHIS